MRFALVTGQENTTWDTLATMWDVADGIDLWESAWTGDHFVPFLSDPSGPCMEGWTTLTALAARTRRIRCGILVAGMPHRHPAVLAKMAAALDVVSEGRLNLGLGASWNDVELGAFGIELGDLRTRFDRFDEGVEVITRLVDPNQETTTFSGEHYRLVDARCSPKPVQPHLPVTVGGTGEQRTARAVARWADHWDLGFTRPEDVPAKRKALAEHCATIGRNPDEVTISAVVLTRHGDERRPLDDVVDELERYADAGCTLALVETVASDPDGARAEVERLTTACQPLATT